MDQSFLLKVVSISLLLVGVSFLIFSINPLCKICRQSKGVGWKTLFALTALFIIGYAVSITVFAFRTAVTSQDLTFSVILCCGGAFVLLVIHLSYGSLTKLKNASDKALHVSLHDRLTQLPNRRSLFLQLEADIEHGDAFSLLIVDLVGLKQLNDAFGYQAADDTLIHASQILNEHVDKGSLFHLGSDEFAILYRQDHAQIHSFLSKLLHALSENYSIGSANINLHAHAGISHYPDLASTPDSLIKQADIAMYECKNSHQPFMVFSDEMEQAAVKKLKVHQQIKQAIEERRLELNYQAIHGLTDEYEGAQCVEALLRLPLADGTYLSPAVFIPVAEQSSLIHDLTEYVVKQVVRDIEETTSQGLSLRVHVNLSVKDLHDNRLFSLLSSLVSDGKLKAEQLELELTESAMMDNVERVRHSMEQLSELGFSFSVDDFGTGFSSLSLLRELPINQIKIDRSFIRNIAQSDTDKAIVRSTINLAHDLGCSAVAEGVENDDCLDVLKKLECDYSQGYLHCKPKNLAEIIDYYAQYLHSKTRDIQTES